MRLTADILLVGFIVVYAMSMHHFSCFFAPYMSQRADSYLNPVKERELYLRGMLFVGIIFVINGCHQDLRFRL